jgi:outer membrane protein assembly factor BamE
LKVLRLVPLALILAACSSVNVPISPYRIDVQQGNALEQESVDKLKPGMTRSQVRFLLGTPLLVDPFHGNRWDYVYNYRKAGKLAEERRLVLFFDGDVLVRIEAEGFAPHQAAPAPKPEETSRVPEKASATAVPAVTAPQAEPVRPGPARTSAPGTPGLDETSIVAPLKSGETTSAKSPGMEATAGEARSEPLILQPATNVEVIKASE